MINRVESYIEFTYFQSSDENLGTLLMIMDLTAHLTTSNVTNF